MAITPSDPATPTPTRPAPPRRRYGLAIGTALFGLLAVVLVLPDVVRLDRFSPFSQLVAFRPMIAAGAAVLAVALGVLAIKFRPVWPFAAVLALVVCVAAALVLPRVVSSDPPPAGGRQLTVLAFNALFGGADVVALTDLIQRERPDLVALSEAGPGFRSRLSPLVRPLGYRVLSTDDGHGSEVGGMTTLVATGLGEVRLRASNETAFPHVELSGGGLGELRFVAVHPVPPTPGRVPQWRADLATLTRWCGDGKPAIVAGDFNATLDHSVLRAAIEGCGDAAAQRGAGLIGTWRSTWPRWIGPQIDHVFATDGITARDFGVYDIPGSDHRAVLARLALPS